MYRRGVILTVIILQTEDLESPEAHRAAVLSASGFEVTVYKLFLGFEYRRLFQRSLREIDLLIGDDMFV